MRISVKHDINHILYIILQGVKWCIGKFRMWFGIEHKYHVGLH